MSILFLKKLENHIAKPCSICYINHVVITGKKLLDDIKLYISHSIDVKTAILNNEKLLYRIYSAAQMIIEAMKKGKKLLIVGSGSSAADAMRMCTELSSRFYMARPALPCIALSADSCAITSISNDFGFENIYARQIKAIGREGDILLAISTSGGSSSILRAIDTAKEKKMKIIFLTCEMASASYLQMADWALNVPSSDPPLVQEAHNLIEHLICYEVEKEIKVK